jgi:hypothetical protein
MDRKVWGYHALLWLLFGWSLLFSLIALLSGNGAGCYIDQEGCLVDRDLFSVVCGVPTVTAWIMLVVVGRRICDRYPDYWNKNGP